MTVVYLHSRLVTENTNKPIKAAQGCFDWGFTEAASYPFAWFKPIFAFYHQVGVHSIWWIELYRFHSMICACNYAS